MKTWKIVGGIVVGVAAVAAAPFTGGGSIIAGAAALGLGTTTAIASAIVAGAVGGFAASFWDDDKKLGVIGMKGSGKTTLLFKLGGVKEMKYNTSEEKYEEFTFKTSSHKTVHVKKGKDIGGTKNYIAEYKDIIQKNNVIFYFFDINQYLSTVEYRRECNSRLSFIFPHLENKVTVLVATHADKSKLSKNELKESIMKIIIDKNYSKLFTENFFILNLIDDNQFSHLIESLFK